MAIEVVSDCTTDSEIMLIDAWEADRPFCRSHFGSLLSFVYRRIGLAAAAQNENGARDSAKKQCTMKSMYVIFVIHCFTEEPFMQVRLSGNPNPEEVLGRDTVIAELWQRLEQGSVVITAERRMGKTSVIQKMNAQQPPRFIGDYQDLEKISSPEDLVRNIYNKIFEVLSTQQQFKQVLQNLLKDWGGEKFLAVGLPKPAISWQQNLQSIIKDLSAQLESDEIWVFFWDELPLAVENIRREHGASEAMSVLDNFRSIRQTYRNIRMVYTGSIGLHHVISKLRDAGYSNSPINDMYQLNLPPLADEDALDLAQQLLIGENIATTGLTEVSNEIVQAVNGIPFYIHHVVDRLKGKSRPVEVTDVMLIISKSLEQINAWDLGDYEDRIQKYYLEGNYNLALQALDILAFADRSIAFGDLLNLVKNEIASAEKEGLRKVLKLLEQDHYIAREVGGGYYFRFQLIKKYWQIHRRG
jgi:AAA+ ATPase superfamily predicted ATPase